MVRITTTPKPWQSSGAPTRIWRPEVTENTGPTQDHTPFRVNLQHSSDSRPPQGFNSSALPFETDQRVKHMQYNSPLGIYSDKSAAEQYVQQTQGFVENQGARAAAGRADEPAYLRSETLRLLKEQEHGAPTTLSNHPNPSGLPVCFMCTRPILGVMARAAGKNLHGDCLSCATCGNSLRNVGHHFIEDKFYCDIHGTQRKAGGRPGMDPNIFVKSSPTAAQPVHVQQESPRAAYHPQINQYARPVSVSPVPSAGGKTITTHYHTPKTQGILSPAQRGVPNAAFGADLSKTVTYGGGVGPGGTHYDPNRLSPAPSQFSQGSRQTAPPPVPSNPPPSHENPSSRVPDSVRSAVSPRRTGKVPRQWPPPQAPPTNRYWQIDPADALKKEKEKLNYGEDLAALIKEVEAAKGAEPKGAEPKKGAESKRKARRASNISKEQVKEAFEEHRKRKEAELRVDVKGEEHKGAEPKGAEPPKIESGIHWTVIHSPVRSPSPAKVTSEPSDGIFKPIPKYATPPPIQISKTATPVPFQAPPPSQAPPIPLPRSPELSPVRSYIVRSSDANITTSTELQTTVTRFSAAPPTNLAPPTARVHDQSTSPIPSIRLHRKNEKITVPTLSVEAATSSIKVKEATPTQAPPTVGFSENQAPPTFRNQAPAAFSSSDDQTPPTFKIDRPYEAPPTSHETTPPRSVQQREQAPPARYEAPPTSHDVPKFEAQLTRSAQHKEQAPPLQAPPPKFKAPPTFQPREQTPPLLDHTALMDQVGRPSEYSYNPGSIKIHEPTGPRPLTVSPKPFLSSAHYHEAPPTPTTTVRRDPKHFKKVDFSKTSPTVIPKTEWKDSADIIDESDILTEEIDDCSLLKAATYDGDESEMIDDVATFEIEEEEILEVSRPSKIRVVGKSQGGGEAEQLWRQRAMELLDDDAQTERDLMIVAALNERLQGLREMEDDDRVRAIECIARHQSELEQTQTQLSTLLESAIVYLQNLRPVEDTPEPSIAGDRVAELRKKVLDDLEQLPILGQAPPPPERKVFPFESYQPDREGAVETQSLHDVLDEFYSIRKPSGRSDSSAEDSRNFLAARLGQVMISDKNGVGDNGNGNLQGSSYTKTSFERTTTNGDAPQAGHLTTTTTTTQQQNGGRVPYCEACKNQIRGAFVLAAGKSWCPEHFVCANSSCRRRLLECGFVEEDGQKFCESCFEQHIAPKCSKCSKSIISDCLNALQKKWHPTCFTCAHCQKPFGNSAFYLEAGLPYCEQDWNALFTTKCVSCRYPIEAGDRWVEALGNAFHSNCFTCARCNINLEGESFFAKNGQPFCRNHA